MLTTKKGAIPSSPPARGNALNFELVTYKDAKVNGMVNTVDPQKREALTGKGQQMNCDPCRLTCRTHPAGCPGYGECPDKKRASPPNFFLVEPRWNPERKKDLRRYPQVLVFSGAS